MKLNHFKFRYFNQDYSDFNLNGGFMIGVYGMWNLYSVSVMIFYAPSHKDKCNAKHYNSNENSESVEFIKMQTKVSQRKYFAFFFARIRT